MSLFAKRFRGYLPVVVDVETGGFFPRTHALLEVAAITLRMDEDGWLYPDQQFHYHIQPHPKTQLDKEALAFNGIDPYHPFRLAQTEEQALGELFEVLRKAQKAYDCRRCVLVGHNAWFDLEFLKAAIQRNTIKHNPFHAFTSFDTATLSGLAYGQTVLARACEVAGIAFDTREAHSALYDADRTAELFCRIVNHWQQLGGWPLNAQVNSTK